MDKNGRLFSLFSLVKFPKDVCRSASRTYSNGTCYTSDKCSSKGGLALGDCAAGFGVCCVFVVSATSRVVSENSSYIVKPNYPSNYAQTRTPTLLDYTIRKCSSDICRVRLDYELFVLDGPDRIGKCSGDSMTISTADSTTTLAAGKHPYLCGTNTGHHSYLDLSSNSADSATLSFILGRTTNNQWKIKVTQYSCLDAGISSQQGCFQYHTGITGTIQNYNFAGGQQLAGQNYKNCIRPEEGYCCIQYNVNSYGMGGAVRSYLGMPGTHSLYGDHERSGDLRSGDPAGRKPVISCEYPFEITHVTRIVAPSMPAGDLSVGFQLTYSQIYGSCFH